MLKLSSKTKVYLALGATDMRKSINGLSIIVSEQMQMDTFSGNLFGFCNRNQNILKILYWDESGFCLWHKRLEKDHFKWPENHEQVMDISSRELSWLIAGLNIHQAHKSLKYSMIF
ncbi:MAG: IS66 family insertion sequence element accessory protein TnpB [Desulfobacteraceae bacterium]|nr:IS66 family insertion sequence element accessory protein TnpB [Desulfobacteraceae bacterium]